MMKRIVTAGAGMFALCLAFGAQADPLRVKAGSVDVDLSATQMSRIVVQGQRIVSVRSLDDPAGPQVLTQNDAATGDLFLGFDGDTLLHSVIEMNMFPRR